MQPYKQLFTLLCFIIIATGSLAQQCLPAPPVCVPGHGYAFRYSEDTAFGLRFNTASDDYEFTNGSANAMFGIDAFSGDISFPDTGSLLVGPNRYAFRFRADLDYGLFFSSLNDAYEFRSGDASPVFSVGANSGDLAMVGNMGIGFYSADVRLQAASNGLADSLPTVRFYQNNCGTFCAQERGAALQLVNENLFGLDWGASLSFADPANVNSNDGGAANIHLVDRRNPDGTGGLAIETRDTAGILDERMRIDKNGRVGIGTIDPNAKFHVTNGNVLFGDPLSTAEGQFMWFFDEGAICAGNLHGYPDSIGLYSSALGDNVMAIGQSATAMGINTRAVGNGSTAMGVNTRATGQGSIVMGMNSRAVEDAAVAMGFNSKASGFSSTAMGGFSEAAGWYSTTSGRGTIARSIVETVFGAFNTDYSPTGEGDSWVASDRLFVIGNGVNAGSRSNALVILKNGRTGIGTSFPGGQFELSLDQGRKPSTSTWTVSSDERLKDITATYEKGLEEILRLEPIKYRYKNVGERRFDEQVLRLENVGFSAQKVREVFPESIGVDDDGYLNFNMHAILVAQINAIKELNQKVEDMPGAPSQQDRPSHLETEVENLRAMNKSLTDRMDQLENLLNRFDQSLDKCCSIHQGSAVHKKASLGQNIPNPFGYSTLIPVNVPEDARDAYIQVTDPEGKTLKTIDVDHTGVGNIEFDGSQLTAGTYYYSLIIDGQVVDTRKMILTNK